MHGKESGNLRIKWIKSIGLVAAVMAIFSPYEAVWADDTRAPQLVAPPRLAITRPKEPAMLKPVINIAPEVATRVGRQVFLNETGGDRDMITAWNAAEDFMSLGIGHFIWFPAGLKVRFKESFPAMFAYMRAHGAKPPLWLDRDPVPACPWANRDEFRRAFRGRQMSELRAFLHGTVGLQVSYLVERMKAALPKILGSLETDAERLHVESQFYRVVAASPDLYPLIDYINFKGEGIVASESYPNAKTGLREGWGLKHVLLEMRGTSTDRADVLGEFSDAAGYVLKRRIRNNPPNKRWQAGWLKRTETYRRPLR